MTKNRQEAPQVNESTATPLWLLCLTVVMTGGGILMLEVLGSRIVGPFFGVSLYIWTALISVALIALSLGYWVGGVVADRRPVAKGMYSLIAAAIVTTLVIPLWDRELCLWSAQTFEIRTGVLVASIILFLPPLFFLGCVSPYAIRLAIHEVRNAGKTAGLLFAVSTLGSVAGSIITGFYLIPGIGVTMTLVVIAVLLAVPCLLWALLAKRAARAAIIALVTIVMAGVGAWRAESRPFANSDSVRLLDERDGRYALLSVAEIPEVRGHPNSDWVRWLLIDGIPQTGVIPERNYANFTPLHEVQFHFYRLHGRMPEHALVVGLGGGAVPMALANQGVDVEVVDIDPLVVEMATQWMGFDPERVPVHIMDGRAYIRQCEKKYDLVVFDVATGGSQPFHLFTQEMFEETARILNPDGVVAINYIGFPQGERDFLARAVFATVTSVFPESRTFIFPARRGPQHLCNIMFFFSKEPFPDTQALHDAPDTSPADRRILQDTFLRLLDHIEPGGAILTDDWNPIERYSVVINEVWREQVFADLQRELHRL